MVRKGRWWAFPPFGPLTVNDAFYAGVKALGAKTVFVSSETAVTRVGPENSNSNDLRNDLQFSRRVAFLPSRYLFFLFFLFSFTHLYISTSHVAIFPAIVSICLPIAERKTKTSGINPEKLIEASFVCQR